MSNEIVFVGAGPIGLWTAVQIKLQRPDIIIVLKEKHHEYKRSHTLRLEHESFQSCVKDDGGVINKIIEELKKNPHIRTDLLEIDLLNLALSLGITIDYNTITNVEQDILQEYPGAAMIIGADGVRSAVRDQIYGPDNAEKTPLAYSAQIKYLVKENTPVSGSSLQIYPLLKQLNFLSFVNVGRKINGKTPVTIQHIIDKSTYDQIQHISFNNAVKLFSDDVESQFPVKLLQDIKTHVGFRLANQEDIIVDTVKLTATELPQQRCKKTITMHKGRYYGLIGDAALALSFFRGMNAGLQLSTQFSKSIVQDWEKIIARDETALASYESYYHAFATAALKSGRQKQSSIRAFDLSVHAIASTPVQLNYFTNEDIATFQRRFEALHKLSQFYLAAHPAVPGVEPSVNSVQSLETWLSEQLIAGLPLLYRKLSHLARTMPADSDQCKALHKLINIKTEALTLYGKAYLALTMSKTHDLLENPTAEQYEAYAQFAGGLKTASPDLYQMLSGILEVIMGIVSIVLGVTVISTGALVSTPVIVGALLVGHGLFQLQKNMAGDSDTFKAVKGILNVTKPNLN